MKKNSISIKNQKKMAQLSMGSFTVRPLSNNKIRKIENGFQEQIKITRDSYLSKELEKYKKVEFIIELK